MPWILYYILKRRFDSERTPFVSMERRQWENCFYLYGNDGLRWTAMSFPFV